MSDNLRLLILCSGDPNSLRTHSGCANALFRALEARGIVHHKADVLGWSDPFADNGVVGRALKRVDRRLGLFSRYRWSQAAMAGNTRRAESTVATHSGFDAVLLYGTNFHPRLTVPMYCTFDATVKQVIDAGAWAFARSSGRRARALFDYQRNVLEDCSAVFTWSEWAADSVTSDYGIPASRVAVMGAGPNHLESPLPHGPYDTRTILFVGVEFERKGGPILLEAFRRLRAREPRAKLIIVGSSPDVNEEGVEVAGMIRKDRPGGTRQLLEYYSQASVFCLMSHFEPLGIVVLEAQNCCVPCVVPRRFAFPETVQDGVTGRLVNDYDPDTLSAALYEMISNPDRLAKMGEAAHSHVRENWTWDVAAERMHRRILADLARRDERSRR